ncbi:short transient receptor potential channel 6-like [Bacillus rossius redtenbacheri]|uniref:short transient receptor potential channel 6-like n=1 Tax=Bacillus rossius redtenbacheri TaxID=93214 RepID=UPI002FDE33AB
MLALGLTALHMAVRSRSLQMLQLLLGAEGVQLGDAALHAVRDDQPAMASALLQRLGSPAEFSGCRDSSEFPEHVTPLMLAAICGHCRTVQMLLRRRHVLARPHPPGCPRQTREQDGLRAAAARMDAYRAACSPAYLCQASRDPVLEAFRLYHELTRCAHLFVAFHGAYSQLAAGCRALAVDLMAQCRTAEEARTVLMQTAGSDYPGTFEFPRLMLAMRYNQKEFVAHSNTQQVRCPARPRAWLEGRGSGVLLAAWSGTWHEWQLRPAPLKMLTVLGRVALLPVVAAVYAAAPFTERAQFWRLAVNKMLNSIAAYLVFLSLLLAHSLASKEGQTRAQARSGKCQQHNLSR